MNLTLNLTLSMSLTRNSYKETEVGKMTPSTFDPFDLGGGGEGYGVPGQICAILTPARYEPLPAPSGHTDSHTLDTYIWGGGGLWY
jgi:hypothetical protein